MNNILNYTIHEQAGTIDKKVCLSGSEALDAQKRIREATGFLVADSFEGFIKELGITVHDWK